MELTEKMNIFYTTAIEVANQQSRQEMWEYTASMMKQQAEFKANKQQEMESRFQIEEGKIIREENRHISDVQTELKRQLNQRQQEKKEALFELVRKMVSEFRETDEYKEFLASKIRMAMEFARQEELVVYLDPEDADKKEWLESQTGCVLTVSEKKFGGGIRAVVRSRNVLIDESLQTKISQEWDAYTF